MCRQSATGTCQSDEVWVIQSLPGSYCDSATHCCVTYFDRDYILSGFTHVLFDHFVGMKIGFDASLPRQHALCLRSQC